MAANQQQQLAEEGENYEYPGQQDGVNDRGCPYISGQDVQNAVSDLDSLLAQMGFSSSEEMMAAAAAL